MRVANRIREYILGEQRNGNLRPGDKLLGYNDLCRKFNTSYATVFNAISNFEKEGLVDRRNGVGVFLRGTEVMNVKLCIPSDILTPKLLALLQKMVVEKRLYLKLEQAEVNSSSGNFSADAPAAISHIPIPGGQILDYSCFPDYHEELAGLSDYTQASNILLPFWAFVYHMSVNPKLLAAYGLQNKISGSDFSWVEDFIKLTAAKGKLQHEYWEINGPNELSRYMYLLTGMLLNERHCLKELFSEPFFNTWAGVKLIRLLKCFSYDPRIRDNFKDSACNFYAGSWLAVQYKQKFGLEDDDLEIIPYMHQGRLVYYFKQLTFGAYTKDNLTAGEKQRLWELVKIIISKQFQLAMANSIGVISVRGDIGPRDYAWNTRPDFNYFIPQPGGIVISGNIIKDYIIYIFSTLVEQVVFFNAETDKILELCDQKLGYRYAFDAKITVI